MSPFTDYMNIWLEKAQKFDFEDETWAIATPYSAHKSKLAKVSYFLLFSVQSRKFGFILGKNL